MKNGRLNFANKSTEANNQINSMIMYLDELLGEDLVFSFEADGFKFEIRYDKNDDYYFLMNNDNEVCSASEKDLFLLDVCNRIPNLLDIFKRKANVGDPVTVEMSAGMYSEVSEMDELSDLENSFKIGPNTIGKVAISIGAAVKTSVDGKPLRDFSTDDVFNEEE